MYDIERETIEDGTSDLNLTFGKINIINIKQAEYEKLGFTKEEALDFFNLVIQRINDSSGFKQLLLKSETLDKFLGKEEANTFNKTVNNLMAKKLT